jgi:hypothetical protein
MIYDSSVCEKLADWLNASSNMTQSSTPLDTSTYHLEDKSTLGRYNEPFMMSNNQLDLVSLELFLPSVPKVT